MALPLNAPRNGMRFNQSRGESFLPIRPSHAKIDESSNIENILLQPDIVIKTNKGYRNASFQTGNPTSHTSQTTKAVTAAMVAKRAVSISQTSAGFIGKKQS